MSLLDPSFPTSLEGSKTRAEDLFRDDLNAIRRRTDRLFCGLLIAQWLGAIIVTLMISPRTWAGTTSQIHSHLWAAILLGGAIVGPPVLLAQFRSGRGTTRHAVAAAQMMLGILLIHLTGGRIETHFHIFGSLAFVSFYRDWHVLVTASAVVALDHILRGSFWPRSVFGMTAVEPWRWAEHVGWVAFEDIFLFWSCHQGLCQKRAIADRQARLEAMHAQIEKEVEQRTAELRESEARKTSIFESALDAIVTMDHHGHVVEFNPAAEATFGFRREEVLGKPLAEMIVPPSRAGSGNDGLAQYLAIDGGLSGRRVEVPALRADGTEFAAEMSINPIRRDGAPLFTAFIRDITDRKKAEQELQHQARHDLLTGLPNRVEFQGRLEHLLGFDQESIAALLLVDLDRFKEINDTFGHHYGDMVLKRISPRLREAVAGLGTIARLGGDEFAILLPGADAAKATQIAEAVLASLRPPVMVDDHSLEVNASVGIALSPGHARDPVALLQCADMAMYAAKRARVGYLAYSPEQSNFTPRRLEMISELRRGIEEGQLVLHYQPKVDLRTRRPVGAEALVRWMHPKEGLLPPGQFIPLAEHAGLIRPLCLWAVNTALSQCSVLSRAGLRHNVAVNLAADNLADANLVEIISDLMASSDAPIGCLTVEITESAMMADPIQSRDTLGRLRSMGIRVSIDDFGTGYSSLAYLKDLPVDEVKIDRSFVGDLARGDRGGCIVRAVIDIAHDLGLHVVAEGVEDRATLDRLADLGCDTAQGFYFSRPIPAANYSEWLRQETRQLAEV